jgi:hypothetical protein
MRKMTMKKIVVLQKISATHQILTPIKMHKEYEVIICLI